MSQSLFQRQTSVRNITRSDLDTFFDEFPTIQEQLYSTGSLDNLRYGIMRDFLLDISRMQGEPSRVSVMAHIKRVLEL